ncbi:MAG: hypothetical protein QM682_04870 [Paracoccus sp. (in: a-proteobacteria)]|uniref:hypothetical protein n=1 Tax=Paracoccus sp. TaxID=267 RepID=UPI0039E2C4D4
MMRRFLKETPAAGLRPLTVGQHLVHDSWDQIHAHLSDTLGPAHAALFVEPFRGAGSISWMASTPDDAVPYSQLPPDRQERVLGRLNELLEDIRRFAAECNAGKSDANRQWGALLEAIQHQPSEVELRDRLFVAGDQPVLILWGCRDEGTVSTGSLLRETRALIGQPPPVLQPRPPAAPVVPPGGGRRRDPGCPGGRGRRRIGMVAAGTAVAAVPGRAGVDLLAASGGLRPAPAAVLASGGQLPGSRLGRDRKGASRRAAGGVGPAARGG